MTAEAHLASIGAYTRGTCRCTECSTAASRYRKRYRLITRADRDGRPSIPLIVPADAVRRHIELLKASGWNYQQIADEAGISRRYFIKLRRAGKRVKRTTAARILSLQPLTPVEVDEVVVERLAVPGVHWHDVPCTRAERLEAWALAVRRGEGRTRAADRLGLSIGRDVGVAA